MFSKDRLPAEVIQLSPIRSGPFNWMCFLHSSIKSLPPLIETSLLSFSCELQLKTIVSMLFYAKIFDYSTSI